MGYRSDVAFACDPIVKDIVQTVAEWDKEFKELLDYSDNLSNDDLAAGYSQMSSGTKVILMCKLLRTL